jgi:hypothetical protein
MGVALKLQLHDALFANSILTVRILPSGLTIQS